MRREFPRKIKAAAITRAAGKCEKCQAALKPSEGSELEMYEGRLQKVVDASRTGWWRFHQHYDRDGCCDNPARGY